MRTHSLWVLCLRAEQTPGQLGFPFLRRLSDAELPVDLRAELLGALGGMEAARLCRLRGFEVSLCEASDHLGGSFKAASVPDFKEEDKRLLAWYDKQLKDLEIPVYLNTPVDNALVEREKADAVIIATGAVKRQLPIPGADQAHVCDAKEYLLEKRPMGQNVTVIGGGLTGCEVAYTLALQGKTVSLVEMMPDILQVADLCRVNSDMLRDLFRFHNVHVYTGAATREIGKDYLRFEKDGEMQTIAADNVIMAVGYKPTPVQITVPGVETYVIGDADHVANLLNSVWGATDAVNSL